MAGTETKARVLRAARGTARAGDVARELGGNNLSTDRAKLIATIRSYRDLPENWDRYGAKPSCQRAIDFAVQLLEAVPDMLPTNVVPISTGVYLEWLVPGRCLGIEVDDTSVLIKDDEDKTFSVELAVERVKRFLGKRTREGKP